MPVDNIIIPTTQAECERWDYWAERLTNRNHPFAVIERLTNDGIDVDLLRTSLQKLHDSIRVNRLDGNQPKIRITSGSHIIRHFLNEGGFTHLFEERQRTAEEGRQDRELDREHKTKEMLQLDRAMKDSKSAKLTAWIAVGIAFLTLLWEILQKLISQMSD